MRNFVLRAKKKSRSKEQETKKMNVAFKFCALFKYIHSQLCLSKSFSM